MSVVSNTSPLNYLAWIGQSEILPSLYGKILVPPGVLIELRDVKTPQPVRDWLARIPDWLEVRQIASPPDPSLNFLGLGEAEVITLVRQLGNGVVLMDDRDGRNEAEQRQIKVIGTLGVIADAADLGLLDLEDAIARLQRTSFRAAPRLLKALLDRGKS